VHIAHAVWGDFRGKMITLGMLLMRAALWWQRMFTSEYAKTSELYTFSSHSLKIDMLWSLIYSREVTLLICFDVADTMLGWLVRENDQQRGDNKNLAILQSPSVVFISCSFLGRTVYNCELEH
jgi:hypothetical protein